MERIGTYRDIIEKEGDNLTRLEEERTEVQNEITEAEKRAAKRRIQGNVTMQDSPDGSGEEREDDAEVSARKMSTRPTIDTLAASAM